MTTTTQADIHEFEEILQPIPESVRTKRVSGQFWIWAGANIAPINWVLGALGIGLGLGLRDTLIVLIAGNVVGMALFGVFVVMGQQAGVTGMVLSRAAFGRRGAYVPAAIQAALAVGWCAVNTWIVLDLVMALLGRLGLVDPDAPNITAKILVAAAVMTIQVTIAWFGYRTIARFERWTVPPTLAVLVLMSVVAWVHLPIDWSYAGPAGHVLHGGERVAAMSAVMTVIGIGWGITWFAYACDYSRFVSTTVPKRRLYLASVLGQFIPVVWLGVLGASLATTNGSVDPGKLIVENYGALAIPVRVEATAADLMDGAGPALPGQRAQTQLAGHYPGQRQGFVELVPGHMKVRRRRAVIGHLEVVGHLDRAVGLDDHGLRWREAEHLGL